MEMWWKLCKIRD